MQVCQTSAGFLTYRCLSAVRRQPFFMCHGDIRSNLSMMAEGACPEEPCSSQAWDLLRMGCPVEVLVDVWQAMKEVSWTTAGTEQLQAGASQAHKFHPAFERDSLACRSLLWEFRALLTLTPDELRMAKLSSELAKLQKAPPLCAHMSGRQVFFQQAVAQAVANKEGVTKLPPGVLKAIMSQHGEAYKKLDWSQKSSYEREAAIMVQQRQQLVQDGILDARSRIAIEAARLAEAADRANPWRWGACSLTDGQKDFFRRLYRSPEFSRANVERLRRDAILAPTIPNMEYKLQLMAQEVYAPSRHETPQWVRIVCLRGGAFASHILVVRRDEADGGDQYFLMLWAFMSPLMLGVVQLGRRPWGFPSMGEGDTISFLNEHWRFDFEITDKFYFSDNGRMDWSIDDMSVLGHVLFLPGSRVVSDARLVAFRGCVDGLPVESRQQPPCGAKLAPRTTPSASSQADFLRLHPWAMEFLADGQAIRAREQAAGGDEVASEDGAECEVLDLFDGEALFEAMQVARDATEGEDTEHFRMRPLMGRWTLRHVGGVCDA